MLLRAILCGGVWNGFLLGKMFPAVFVEREMVMVIYFESTFPHLLHVRELPEFASLVSINCRKMAHMFALAWLVAWARWHQY